MMLRVYKPISEEAPWWLGFAWHDYATRRSVCYPIPLNWIARWLHVAWSWLRIARGGQVIDEELQQSHDRGYAKGYRDAREQALSVASTLADHDPQEEADDG